MAEKVFFCQQKANAGFQVDNKLQGRDRLGCSARAANRSTLTRSDLTSVRRICLPGHVKRYILKKATAKISNHASENMPRPSRKSTCTSFVRLPDENTRYDINLARRSPAQLIQGSHVHKITVFKIEK